MARGSATGLTADESGFYVKPIRDIAQTNATSNCILAWDRDGGTGEIFIDCSGSRRRLEEQDDLKTRIADLERKLESALASEARIAHVEAQIKALLEKAPAA